jgi:hypothetical protein
MLRPSSLLALLTVRHHQLAPEDVLHPSLLSIRWMCCNFGGGGW